LDPLYGYLATLEGLLNDAKISSINFGPETKSIEVAEVVKVAIKTWRLETNIEIIGSESDASTEASSLDLNPELAKRILKWTPIWSQTEAIISTVQWWDKVLNQGIKPIDACLDDLNNLLSRK
jgi:nucleoside-diphosphate-sugar epimerase